MKKQIGGVAAFGAAALLMFYGYRYTQPARPTSITGTWMSEEMQGQTMHRTTMQFDANGSGQKIVLTRRPPRGSSKAQEDITRTTINWGVREDIFYIDEGPWNWELRDDQKVLVLSTGPPFNYTWSLTRQ